MEDSGTEAPQGADGALPSFTFIEERTEGFWEAKEKS